MKVLAGLIWASGTLGTYAASPEASIYVHGNSINPRNSNAISISPNTARLLLAQRLGLTQYHDLGGADETTLHVLNTYGGEQRAVFRDEEESRQQSDKLLFIIEGVEHPGDVVEPKGSARIAMLDPPQSAQNAQLAKDLLEQALHAGAGKTRSHIQHISTLQGLSKKDGSRYTHALAHLKTLLKTHLDRHPRPSSTIILMPPHYAKSSTKRDTTSPYGSYSMPLTRRFPQSQLEEPLEEPVSEKPSPPDPSESSEPTPPKNQTLPAGVLPVCHSSSQSAIDATNNCSSHGQVYLRATGGIDCYTCRCGTTSFTNSEGKTKTTYWGGPACQKKDVSVQFWLLAGLTIALLSIVGWGIGLLASIGQEDLPSVIGAGVAGPRATK